MKIPHFRIPRRQSRSTILIVDEVQGAWEENCSAYWRASVLTSDIVEVNPRNYGMYKRTKDRERIMAWVGVPVVVALMAGGSVAIAYPQALLSTTVSLAFLGGSAAGVLIGLPLARMIIALALQVEYLYVLGRIPAEMAKGLGLQVPAGVKFVLIWATPPPLLTGSEDDAKTLIKETEMTLWRLEQLKRGVDGWSTENFIEVAIAEQHRRDSRRRGQPDSIPAVNIDRSVSSDQLNLPGGRNGR